MVFTLQQRCDFDQKFVPYKNIDKTDSSHSTYMQQAAIEEIRSL